ncbi:MAG: ATP synthase F1 subunit delta [Ruminococcaceae bacterium]|nr:ATP synthase F1 subunit delta [Oscillospiraceae bacterium]
MTQIGSIYGQALYDLASSEGLSQPIWQELHILQQCFCAEQPDFLNLLSTPSIPKQERCQILDDSFADKLQPYVLNFLKILTEKGYMRHFDHCCTAYRDAYYRDNGILLVEAVSAAPLTDDQTRRLAQKLTAVTGKQIELHSRVDPDCIAGIRLVYDGKQVDDTLQHRLSDIGKLLKNTAL